PPTHVLLAHTTLQFPQLFGSVARWASHPLLAIMSQFEYPPLHPSRRQLPPMHVEVEFGSEHGVVQLPQWAGVLLRSVSQPLVGTLSQSPWPVRQLPTTHVLLTQAVEVACGSAVHAWPHAPQLNLSLVRLISQPVGYWRSQFAYPEKQLWMPQTPLVHLG